MPCLAIDYTATGRYFGSGGRSFDGLAHLADWMPTLLSFAGAPGLAWPGLSAQLAHDLCDQAVLGLRMTD